MNSFGQNTREQVLKILQDPDEINNLTAEQQELVERWNFSYSCYVRYRSPKTVAQMIMKHYSCARSTAYEYVRAAMDLFGGQRLIDDTADIVLWEAMMRGLRIAEKDKDMKAAARIYGEMNKYIARRQAMLQDFDPAMLKTGDLIVTLNPADIGFTLLPEEEVERLKKQITRKQVQLRENADGSFGK